MPILDLQRNHASVFNIRFGEKINGRPAKLTDRIRVTSPNAAVVQAFVDTYGGEVREWETGYEAYLPRTDIPIMVLPGQSVQQWWELYKGGVCDRRCDGETETLSGQPCMCPSPPEKRLGDAKACKPMTRLNFICPEVPVIGAGSLVTHGKIAAETLPQAVMVAESALKAGQMVPAILRSVTRIGKNRQYVVPQIEIVGISLRQLMAGDNLGAGALSTPSVEPDAVGELPAAERPGGKGEGEPKQEALPPAEEPSATRGQSRSATPSTGSSTPASQAQREAVRKQAARKRISDDDLADLCVETTGKYLEEKDFSVAHVNAVLDALTNR